MWPTHNWCVHTIGYYLLAFIHLTFLYTLIMAIWFWTMRNYFWFFESVLPLFACYFSLSPGLLIAAICSLTHGCSFTTENIQKRNDKGQRELNRFMPTEVHIWHLPACKVSFLVTLKHHPGWGLSLTWQFAVVFTRLPWMQQNWQTLVCPQLLSVVSKESTLRPSCCVWMPVGALMSQLWHKKSQDLLPHLDQQVCIAFRTLHSTCCLLTHTTN